MLGTWCLRSALVGGRAFAGNGATMRVRGRKSRLSFEFVTHFAIGKVLQMLGLPMNTVGRHIGSINKILFPQPVGAD